MFHQTSVELFSEDKQNRGISYLTVVSTPEYLNNIKQNHNRSKTKVTFGKAITDYFIITKDHQAIASNHEKNHDNNNIHNSNNYINYGTEKYL